MTTVAVVGIGRWGKNLVRCFDRLSEVAYCCHTGDGSNAAQIREQYPHVTLTTQYDDVLTDPAVDAVVVATPIGTHVELAKRAIAADKHVFVEKPLASDVAGARELVELAAARDVCLFTGYVFLYSPAMQELHDRLADDPAVRIRANWEKYGTFDAPITETLVCHDVAISEYLMAGTLESGTVVSRTGVRTDADLLDAYFESGDGRPVTASYDRTSPRNQKTVAVVAESGARYEFCDDELFVLEDDDYRNVTPSGPEPLTVECRAFLDWIREGEEPPSAGAFGRTVNETLERL